MEVRRRVCAGDPRSWRSRRGRLLSEAKSGSEMETIGSPLYVRAQRATVDAAANRRPRWKISPANGSGGGGCAGAGFVRDLWFDGIAGAKNENELEEIKLRLIDRFGLLPVRRVITAGLCAPAPAGASSASENWR